MSIGFDATSVLEKLYAYVQARRSKAEYKNIRRHLETRKLLEKESILDDFLFSYYRDLSKDFYKTGSWRYAIAIPNNWRQVLSIDDVLGPLRTHFEREEMIDMEKVGEVAMASWCNYVLRKDSPWEDQRAWVKGPDLNWINRSFYPGPTFALERVAAHNGEIKINHYVSNYYSYISTCEYLSYELIKQFDMHGTKPEESDFQQFSVPLRDELASSGNIYEFQKRSAKVGINIFLVGHLDGDLYCVLVYRDQTVAEFPGRYSVIPAGTFAPRGPSHKEWYSMRLSVFCELIEECVRGIDEIKRPKSMHINWLYEKYRFLNRLRESLSEEKSKLMFTALGMDLLTAKPEVCGTLYLSDDLFLELFRGELNFETKYADRYRLNDKELLRLLRPGKIVPAGAVSIIEGLRFCEDELQAKTILSDIGRHVL